MKLFLIVPILMILFLCFLFFECGYDSKGLLSVEYLPDLYVCKPKPGDFSSLISGLLALVAAVVAYLSIKEQIENENQRFNKQHILQQKTLRVQVLQTQYEMSFKIFGTSSLISADIKSLVVQLEGMRDTYSTSDIIAHYASSNIPLVCINENYFATFDSLIGDVVFDDLQLSENILSWYTRAKSYVDQIKYDNEHINKMSEEERIPQIKSYQKETLALIELGHDNISKIRDHAEKYHLLCVDINQKINQILLE